MERELCEERDWDNMRKLTVRTFTHSVNICVPLQVRLHWKGLPSLWYKEQLWLSQVNILSISEGWQHTSPCNSDQMSIALFKQDWTSGDCHHHQDVKPLFNNSTSFYSSSHFHNMFRTTQSKRICFQKTLLVCATFIKSLCLTEGWSLQVAGKHEGHWWWDLLQSKRV